MGWRTVVINKHSKLSYKNNHLVFKAVDQHEMIHLSEIDVLLLETADITVTTMLLNRLIDFNILVLFCDSSRLPVAKILPFYARHDSSLQLKKQIEWQEEKKSDVWTEIISQKILNQAKFLEDKLFLDKSASILLLHGELEPMDLTNREGHAARIYFNTLFGNDFKRESDDPINAGLNYGYTILLSIVARELVQTGCMTQFGLKHINQFNDFNLASDLMEPFRPIIDEIIYQNRNDSFKVMKRSIFEIFENLYPYDGKQMYLTNIISDYIKKVVKELNNEGKGVPVFRI